MLPFPIMNQYGNIAPVPTIKIQDFKSAPSGNATTLRYSNYDLYALGTNTNGRFGTGDTTALSTWVKIATNIKTYCVDAASCYIVKNDGTIWAAGSLAIYNGANLNGSSTGWGVTTPSSVFVDMTYTYPALMKTRGIKQIESSSSPFRQWVVDSTGVLWGLGSQVSYTLGTNVTTPNTDWIQITTNVDRVFSTQQSVWIIKNDKTIWRSGINTSGQVAGTASTDNVQGFTELNIYSPLTYLDMNTIGNANIQLLLSDGSMRFYGTQSWVNSSGVQLQPGYTPSITGTPATIRMNNSGGSNPNYFSLTSNNIWAEGSNNAGSLGIGNTANAYAGTWFSALTGVLLDPSTAPSLSDIKNMSSVTNAGFVTTENEVYATGSSIYTSSPFATGGYWVVQRTPHSSIYTQADANPALTGTTTDLSSTSILGKRYYHAMATWGTKVLVFGGLTSSTAFADSTVSSLLVYDTVAGTWSTMTNTLGGQRFGAAMTVVGDNAYIWGGFTTTTSQNPSNLFYKVDLTTGTWTNITSTVTNNPSAGQYGKMVATSDGMIYMLGRSETTQLLQFNPNTNVWTTMTPAPIASQAATGITTDGKDLYFGSNSVGFYKYITASNTWIQLINRSVATSGKYAYNNGVIYFFQGNTLFSYRISTGIWTTIGTAGYSTGLNEMIFCNGYIYFSGGSSSTATLNFVRIN